jgi:hypothetical protein
VRSGIAFHHRPFSETGNGPTSAPSQPKAVVGIEAVVNFAPWRKCDSPIALAGREVRDVLLFHIIHRDIAIVVNAGSVHRVLV